MGAKKLQYHSTYCYWTVNEDQSTIQVIAPKQPPDGEGNGKVDQDTLRAKQTLHADGPDYAELSDGLNVLYLVMATPHVGFGICACGGQGGRSFLQITAGHSRIVDGRPKK